MPEPRVRLGDLLSDAPGGALLPAELASLPVASVTDDSRAVAQGGVFVAMRGSARDGHDYLPEAAARGAAVAIVERALAGAPPRRPDGTALPCVPVRDARAFLARATARVSGLWAIQQAGALVVWGITGTNGKTTTALWLQHLLRAGGIPTAVLGTVVYDLHGRTLPADLTTPTPQRLAEMLVEACEAGARAAVMEVSSHALEQRRVDGVRFAGAVFTNLSGDHLDYHRTVERYVAAKKRLFDGLEPSAWAVVNGDDPVSETMVRHCRGQVIPYGVSAAAAFRAAGIRPAAAGVRFVLTTPQGSGEVVLPVPGRFNVSNALAAATAAACAGVPDPVIRQALETVPAAPGRLETVSPPDCPLRVIVDYAHTDDALRNALAAVRETCTGRVLVVFGCGGDRDAGKRPRMGAVAAAGADLVVVTSDNPRSEDPMRIIGDILAGVGARDRARVRVEPDRHEAIGLAIAEARPGDVVLIAGKGHETYQIVGQRRRAFDDRAVGREWLTRLGWTRAARVPADTRAVR